MVIKQQNPDNPNTVVSVHAEQPSKLVVEPFRFGEVVTKLVEFDLTAYQGKPFRLYVEEDGSFSVDPNRDHFWLLAEVLVPERMVESVPTGDETEDGQVVHQLMELPLDLNDVVITVFELPQ